MTDDANPSPRHQRHKHCVPDFPGRIAADRAVRPAADSAERSVEDPTFSGPVIAAVDEDHVAVPQKPAREPQCKAPQVISAYYTSASGAMATAVCRHAYAQYIQTVPSPFSAPRSPETFSGQSLARQERLTGETRKGEEMSRPGRVPPLAELAVRCPLDHERSLTRGGSCGNSWGVGQ